MRLEVGGIVYAHFLSAKVEVDMKAIARKFEFAAATEGVGDIPFRKGQACRVLVDDEPILTGWIEKIEVYADGDAMAYKVAGRDRLADLVDSNLEGVGEVGSTVAGAARAVLRSLGLDAQVIDRSGSGGRSFDAAREAAAVDSIETAAEFLWGIAARRQILLASDGDGNLVLWNGEAAPIDTRLIHRRDGIGNNLHAAHFSTDDSKRFGVYRVSAQANVSALSFFDVVMGAAEIASISAEHVDPAVRSSRRRIVASEASYTPGDAKARARWEANLDRAEGTSYTVEVSRYRDDAGALWALNTAPLVEDEFAGINARMLISGLIFEATEDGPKVTITLTLLDAYQAEAGLTDLERRARAASTNELTAAEIERLLLQ